MLKKLDDLRQFLPDSKNPQKLVLVPSEDAHSLGAITRAAEQGIIEPILVGDRDKTEGLAEVMKISLKGFQFFEEPDQIKAVQKAVRLIRDKKGEVLMKGKVGSSVLLKAILDKEFGLRVGKLLSHFALFEVETYHKLIGVTDVAMNIAPTLDEKIAILNNAVEVFNRLNVMEPKVAVLGAVEQVNINMNATLDAALLSKMNQRGQIRNCLVDGPLAFDNAISLESARHKEIKSEVAGDTDLLLMPDIEVGNVLYKSMVFFAKAKVASMIVGAAVPIILTSRSDSEQAKFDSILLAAATTASKK